MTRSEDEELEKLIKTNKKLNKLIVEGKMSVREVRENQDMDVSQTTEITNKRIQMTIDKIQKENIFNDLAINMESFLERHEVSNWCLDEDILECVDFRNIANETISFQYVAQIVEENLEKSVELIINDPIFQLHKSLIEEAYEAYKVGYYKMAVLSLFPPLEHIITSWYELSITPENIAITKKPKMHGGLRTKINDELAKDRILSYEVLRVNSVLRLYSKFFKGIKPKLSSQLNRNALYHGYYDYDSIDKVDALKLFQLLKASLIIKEISKTKFEDI